MSRTDRLSETTGLQVKGRYRSLASVASSVLLGAPDGFHLIELALVAVGHYSASLSRRFPALDLGRGRRERLLFATTPLLLVCEVVLAGRVRGSLALVSSFLDLLSLESPL